MTDNYMESDNLQGGKLYYSISEVADILGEDVSLVRYWSDTFSRYVKPSRTKNKKNRIYTAESVKTLQTIHYLRKDLGLSIEGTAKRLDENREGLDNKVEVISKLRDIRGELQKIYESI